MTWGAAIVEVIHAKSLARGDIVFTLAPDDQKGVTQGVVTGVITRRRQVSVHVAISTEAEVIFSGRERVYRVAREEAAGKDSSKRRPKARGSSSSPTKPPATKRRKNPTKASTGVRPCSTPNSKTTARRRQKPNDPSPKEEKLPPSEYEQKRDARVKRNQAKLEELLSQVLSNNSKGAAQR